MMRWCGGIPCKRNYLLPSGNEEYYSTVPQCEMLHSRTLCWFAYFAASHVRRSSVFLPPIEYRINIEVESLSINTYGGTEISVFQRCVAGMIERAVRIISIIKKQLYMDIDGRPRAIAYLHSSIAAFDYKLDRIHSNFVKMKQEPQGYNITSDKLEFIQNTLKIM